jgi:hypothetical protein
MAYPTGAEIRSLLPASGAGITEPEAQAFVDEWIERVRLAAPPPDNDDGTPGPTPENGITRRIVRRGAWGDARQLQLVRDGYTETPDADLALTQAEESLEQYDRENVGVDESAPSVALTGLPWSPRRYT